MPMIKIKEKEYQYNENEIINFSEGLIGLPEMRQAVLISIKEFEPFCWLASTEDERNRFIVVNPNEIFSDYRTDSINELANLEVKTLAIVKISSDWKKTTVNLRAPIFINPETHRGTQLILSQSNYGLAEVLPQN